MAKRFTDSEKWKKPFIRTLKAPYKLLWLYITDECNHAGIWQVDMDVACLKIGEKLNFNEALSSFEGKIFIIENGEKWFIPDFIEFQYGTLNPTNRVHESVISLLSKYNLLDENLNIKPLDSPLQRAMDKDKDKDKGKDSTKKESKEKKELFGIGGNIKLTKAEYERLEADYGPMMFQEILDFFTKYKIEKDYKTKDDNLTIRRWVANAVFKNKKESLGDTGETNGKQPSTHDKLRASHEEAQRILAEDLSNTYTEGEGSD